MLKVIFSIYFFCGGIPCILTYCKDIRCNKFVRGKSLKYCTSTEKNHSRNHFHSETRGRITGTERRISANNKHASL